MLSTAAFLVRWRIFERGFTFCDWHIVRPSGCLGVSTNVLDMHPCDDVCKVWMSRVHLLKFGGGLETSIGANHENQTKFKKAVTSAWCTVDFQACSLLTRGSTNNRKRIKSSLEDVSQQHNKFADSYSTHHQSGHPSTGPCPSPLLPPPLYSNPHSSPVPLSSLLSVRISPPSLTKPSSSNPVPVKFTPSHTPEH